MHAIERNAGTIMNRRSLVAGAAMALVVSAAGWSASQAAPVTPAAADETLGMALMAAHVNPSGTLVKGAGAVSSTRTGAGNYSIVFERSVQNCFFSTATTNSGPGTGAGDASIIVFYTDIPTQVLVITNSPPNLAGVDRAFSLTVFCPR
jgi:hypothetical protein